MQGELSTPIVFLAVAFCGLVLVSSVIFVCCRKEKEIQLRCPVLTVCLGLLYAGFALNIFLREDLLKGVKGCGSFLWSGNLFMNMICAFGIMKIWSITVMADRNLRNKFRWTLRTKFFVLFLIFVLIHTSLVTLLTEIIYEGSSPVVDSEQCYFLMPLQVYLPQFGPLAACRFFMAWKIRNVCSDSSLVMDYYGIYKEIIAANLNAVIVISAYLTYAYGCVSGKFQEVFPADFILMFFPCIGAFIFLILPSVKLMVSKCQLTKIVPIQVHYLEDWDTTLDDDEILDLRVMASTDQSLLSSKKILADILNDKNESKVFRTHAQKALFAETVDFYLEILSFNTMVQTFGIHPVQHPKSQQTYFLYDKFCSISNEFVCDSSSSDFHLSCAQKAAILRYKRFEIFCSLHKNGVQLIFEEAKSELETIMAKTLLGAYLQAREFNKRISARRRACIFSEEENF